MKWVKLFEEYKGDKNKFHVYHGTNNKFDIFDLSKIGSNTEASWNGAGIYFSDTKSEASLYGEFLVEAIITLNNPIDLTKIEDSIIQGSGIVKLFASINGLKDLYFGEYKYSELSNILDELENTFDFKNMYFTEGSNKSFQHVWYETPEKEYVLRNRTSHEIGNKNHLKEMILSNILYEKYKISRLPIRINEATSPHNFTKIAKEEGYDGVIAHNSTVFNGNEYVVFDAKNIEIIR